MNKNVFISYLKLVESKIKINRLYLYIQFNCNLLKMGT